MLRLTCLVVLLSFAVCDLQLQMINKPVSFWHAEVECTNLKGHLVSIHSRNDNDHVKDKCISVGRHSCWLGLQHDGSSWKWSDGSPLDYTYWHGGAQNLGSGQMCAVMLKNFSAMGEWAAVDCDAHNYNAAAVCNLKPPANTGHTQRPQHTNNAHHTPRHTTPVPTMAISTVGVAPSRTGGRLTIKGTHFELNGQKVFLSGGNQAWIAYGYDFGDNNYEYRHVEFEKYLKEVSENGGNSIRVWVHIEGAVTPHFDSTGHVLGLDQKGTFINDVKKYLRKALEYNILIFFCLWNGALTQNDHFKLDGLIKDTGKLQSYIDNALIPWVKAVKDEPAMGGWDIINEMEGEIKPDTNNANPCLDTKFLHGSGAGWAGKLYTAEEFLRFINWQVDGIKQADPQALVTSGSWNARSNVDKWGGFNMYKDLCLVKAGGKKMGKLDFYSSHTYAWQGKYDETSPFKHTFAEFEFDRPLVVAEFNQVSGAGMTITEQFNHLYTKGYAGGWTWHLHADGANTDSTATQLKGIKSLMGKNDQTQGGLINLKL